MRKAPGSSWVRVWLEWLTFTVALAAAIAVVVLAEAPMHETVTFDLNADNSADSSEAFSSPPSPWAHAARGPNGPLREVPLEPDGQLHLACGSSLQPRVDDQGFAARDDDGYLDEVPPEGIDLPTYNNGWDVAPPSWCDGPRQARRRFVAVGAAVAFVALGLGRRPRTDRTDEPPPTRTTLGRAAVTVAVASSAALAWATLVPFRVEVEAVATTDVDGRCAPYPECSRDSTFAVVVGCGTFAFPDVDHSRDREVHTHQATDACSAERTRRRDAASVAGVLLVAGLLTDASTSRRKQEPKLRQAS